MAHRQEARAEQRSATGAFLYMLVGPIAWALHLATIYGAHALACARPVAGATEADPARLIVLVATCVLIAALAAALRFRHATARLFRAAGGDEAQRAFQLRVMTVLALLSALAIAWAGATALVVPACLALR